MDEVTETTEQGFFSRLSGAVGGIFGGLISILIAVILLFWNEGRSVDRYATIDFARNNYVETKADTIESDKEGKLVHFSGALKTTDELTDDTFELTVKDSLSLIRKVEMYQWNENKSERTEKKAGGKTVTHTTYSYDKKWSSSVIDSSSFKNVEGHENPATMMFEEKDFKADNVTLGAHKIPSDRTATLGQSVEVKLDEVNLEMLLTGKVQQGNAVYFNVFKEAKAQELLNTMRAAAGFASQPANIEANEVEPASLSTNPSEGAEPNIDRRVFEQFVANPAAPEVGDVRITFSRYPVCDATVVAKQIGDTVGGFATKTGDFYEVRAGIMDAAEVFKATESENAMMTWFLRFLGFILMFGGFSAIFKPISVLADIIPLFGDIAESGISIVSGLLAAVGSLAIIGIAWLFYRPLLAIFLFMIMGAAMFGLITLIIKVRSAKKAVAAAAPAPEPAA